MTDEKKGFSYIDTDEGKELVNGEMDKMLSDETMSSGAKLVFNAIRQVFDGTHPRKGKDNK